MVVKQEDPFVVYFPCLSRHLCGMRIEEMLTLREEKRAAGNFWGRLSSFKERLNTLHCTLSNSPDLIRKINIQSSTFTPSRGGKSADRQTDKMTTMLPTIKNAINYHLPSETQHDAT
ncbi:hypothetical protein JTE90_016697 [Oedothorax gibbosus]|uniref:Uncharacterized protein n=1 Tax=Oedothorax gibbosus TaxID=931172 RepID=A0AAV6V1U2_9ARAC|nr:hypothetical protein JTE90_016697 [Oedothorax gibbosus]